MSFVPITPDVDYMRNFMLWGEECSEGCRVLTYGMDARGNKCVCSGILVKWDEENNEFTYRSDSDGYNLNGKIILTCTNGEVINHHYMFWIYSIPRKRYMEYACIEELKNARSNVLTNMRRKAF